MFNKEEKEKELLILVQSKGQLEASVNKVEKFLTKEEFADYCDNLYTCVAYNQKIQKSIKDFRLPILPVQNLTDEETIKWKDNEKSS